jgi:hypothetical protein
MDRITMKIVNVVIYTQPQEACAHCAKYPKESRQQTTVVTMSFTVQTEG